MIIDEIKKLDGDKEKPYWILIWYGRSMWNHAQIVKEAILINTNKKDFFISNWKDAETKLITLKEELCSVIPIGSIFNKRGRLLISPQGIDVKHGLYPANINIHPSNLRQSGLYELLKGTDIPLYPSDKGELIYYKAPFYHIVKDDVNYIIPIHVINSYFYYMSSHFTHYIVYSKLQDILQIPQYDEKNNKYIIEYNNIISEREAIYFAGYLFANGAKKERYITQIAKQFRTDTLNDINSKTYMSGTIPCEMSLNINVVRQYVTVKDSNQKVCFVYKILEHKHYKIFSDTKFTLIKAIDRRSTFNIENKEVITYTKSINQTNPNFTSKISNTPYNTLMPLDEQDSLINPSFCMDIPNGDIADKEQQKNWYETKSLVHTEKEGQTIEYQESNSSSKSGRLSIVNKTSDIDKSLDFNLFTEVINYINGRNKFAANMLSDIDSQQRAKVAEIKYKNSYFYIIEMGRNVSIPIIALNDNTIKLISMSTIEDLLEKSYRIYGNNWKLMSASNELSYHNVVLVDTLNHTQKINTNWKFAKDSLIRRIRSKIIKNTTS